MAQFIAGLTPVLIEYDAVDIVSDSTSRVGPSRDQVFGDDADIETVKAYLPSIMQLVYAKNIAGSVDITTADADDAEAIDENESRCLWQMTAPDTHTFHTNTLDEEMAVAIWHYGAFELGRGFHMAYGTPDCAPEAAGRDAFMAAAAAFSWATSLANREGFAKFSADVPLMFKAYMCKAMELMAMAYAHIQLAHLAMNNDKRERAYTSKPLQYALAATLLMDEAVIAMRDEAGSDVAAAELIEVVDVENHRVKQWAKFYEAIHVFMTGGDHEALAMAHIDLILSFFSGDAIHASMMVIRTSLVSARPQLGSSFGFSTATAPSGALPACTLSPSIVTHSGQAQFFGVLAPG
jgi:hypothetical protein